MKSAVQPTREDLKVVERLSARVASVLELSRLLPFVLDAFLQVGRCRKGSLMLYDERAQELVIRCAKGLSARARRAVRLRLGEGVAGKVAATGRPIRIADIRASALYRDFFSEPGKLRPRESLVALPLPYQGKLVGVVNLQDKASGGAFTRRDELVLALLANHAAVAINNARLYELAITDGLTGAFTARYFQLRLAEEVERARRSASSLALAMIDLDDFKKFNDTYGHPAGDAALVHAVNHFRAGLRQTDLLCRYGGEEFALVLPNTSLAAAVQLSERLRARLAGAALERDGKNFFLTASFGVSAAAPPDSAERLVEAADQNLYLAKRLGKNRVEPAAAALGG